MQRPILAVLAVTLTLGLSGCGEERADPAAGGGREGTARASVSRRNESSPTTGATKPDPLAKQSAPGRCPGYLDNSPATVDLATGTYAALITDFPSAAAPITFDVVQWMTGQRARDQYRSSHPDDPEGPPNDYYIHNESERTRSAPLASESQIWLVQLASDASADLDEATIQELQDQVSGRSSMNLFWLTFEGGAVVEICEQYVP